MDPSAEVRSHREPPKQTIRVRLNQTVQFSLSQLDVRVSASRILAHPLSPRQETGNFSRAIDAYLSAGPSGSFRVTSDFGSLANFLGNWEVKAPASTWVPGQLCWAQELSNQPKTV